MIAITKKRSKIKLKKNNTDNIDTINDNIELVTSNILNNKSIKGFRNKRNNIKIYNEKNKKIFMTDSSYMINNIDGSKALITKEDLDKITCLQKEKSKLEKKVEEKDDHLMRFLKSELMKEQKIQKIKNKINEKEKKINNFLKNKNEGIKLVENERYQDYQDVYERQKLFEKMLSNYDKKVYLTKKQQQELYKINKTINIEKMDGLKEQIKDYEKKNKEFKKKISDIFDLKDIEGIKIKEKKFDPNNPDLGLRKLVDLEEKLEIEKFRREKALMTHINQFQNKINNILEKKEEKEKKIKKAIEKAEKKREEKRILQSIHYEEVRNNVKKNEKNLENKRNIKLKDLEKKDLKDFAIKQEKIKMYEERKKINQLNYEEREAMKAKLKEIFKEQKEKKIETNENDDLIINKLLNN